MLVPVDARRPFAPEELAVGGVDLIFERLHKRLHFIVVDIDAVLHPEINVRRDVSQGCGHFVVLVRVQVMHPEILFLTQHTRRGGFRHHFGDAANFLEAARQDARIVPGDDGILQRLKSLI